MQTDPTQAVYDNSNINLTDINTMSCPYATLFGVPNKGFHSVRVMGIALYDTLGTIAAAFTISYMFDISFLNTVLIAFVLGEILHYAFGTQTALLTMFRITANKCK
jgi:hypothetical protein